MRGDLNCALAGKFDRIAQQVMQNLRKSETVNIDDLPFVAGKMET